MTINGSCLCKSITYEITGGFKLMGNCHCSTCRKANGAPFVTWGIIDPPQFRWNSGEAFLQAYASSPDTERCFCGKCGSSLVTRHSGAVGEVVVASVDGDPGLRAGAHIFVASKAPWHEITDTLPQFAEWPPGVGH